MEKRDTPYIIDETTMNMYIGSQMGVARSYNPKSYLGENARIIENQSANFLENFINGDIVLDDASFELMPDYLLILKQSSFSRIHKLLGKAKKVYKTEVIYRHKEAEKKRAFIKTKFNILQNKKAMARMTSKDMMTISELLDKVKDYSTKRMKMQLKSFAMLKIERTLNGTLKIDDDFTKLVQTFGTYEQKSTFKRRLDNNQELSERASKVDNKNKAKKSIFKRGFFAVKRFSENVVHFVENRLSASYKKIRKALVVSGITAIGLLGGKTAYEELNKVYNPDSDWYPDRTEVQAKPSYQDDKTAVSAENKSEVRNIEFNETSKSSNNKTKVQDIEFDEVNKTLDEAYKNRFDSALEIHLGAEKRDKLYGMIDKLAQEGKIQFKDGTTREWYAHAFTMYQLVAPYSLEGKTVSRFLKGEEVSAEVLHNLVIQAKRDGTGVHGSGTHSNYDKAPSDVKKKHAKNRLDIKKAKVAISLSKSR